MQHREGPPLCASLDRRGPGATLAQSIPVRETFEGKTVWEGVVHVFDLAGHPTASRGSPVPFLADAAPRENPG